jgi:NAD(P)-dependent dehydrogenase (short-subunit alcohol dehydrogenase family)
MDAATVATSTRCCSPSSCYYIDIYISAIEVPTRYQAKELGVRRIRVNTQAPGAIETDFGGVVRDNTAMNHQLAAQTALGRVGRPEDIGAAVAALLSNDTCWLNGQRVEVSGGMLL